MTNHQFNPFNLKFSQQMGINGSYWHEHGPSETEKEVLDLYWFLAAAIKPKTVIDIGTKKGWSAIYLAGACPEAKVYTIDNEEEFSVAATRNAKMHGVENISFITGPTSTVTWEKFLKPCSVDFAVVDCIRRETAMENLWPFLKHGGYLAMKDTLIIPKLKTIFKTLQFRGSVNELITINTLKGLTICRKT